VASEHQEQRKVATWLRERGHILVFSAIPLGGTRNEETASALWAEGVSRGVPDILVFTPFLGYVGLALEMKTTTGVVSVYQHRFLRALHACGWYTCVAYGAGAAISVLTACYPHAKRKVYHGSDFSDCW
jgi:hypothetical protein